MSDAKILLVFGSKGGVGATTIALALADMGRKSSEVAFVDADLAGRRSAAISLEAYNSLNAIRGDNPIASVKTQTGLELVELTPNLHGGFTLKIRDTETILEEISKRSSLIIVDAPQPFAAAVRPFIARTTRFVLVVEPSLLGMTGARAILDELLRFGIPVARILIVMNARDEASKSTKAEVQQYLGTSVFVEIPTRTNKTAGAYAKAIDTLRDHLLQIPTLEPLNNLLPSSTTPIGDRREPGRKPFINKDIPSSSQPAQPSAAHRSSHRTHEQNERSKLKSDIHAALGQKLESQSVNMSASDQGRRAELSTRVQEIVNDLLAVRGTSLAAEELALIRQEIIDEALGFGPLEELMRDELVSEIMINGPDHIYIEREGKLTLSNQKFLNERQLRLIIERMLAPIGRRIDESQPMVDGRLPDGSRINAIIPPLALDGSSLTIRRFGKKRLQIEDLIRFGAITEEMIEFLRAAVKARLNIVVSGGTGSGKTTFLNVLSNFIPEGERIVTIEDSAELNLDQEHIVRLESKPANLEGKGAISIRDLVKNSLRMRPDRIVVGECRGGEALDMLQAMNTGHDGSLTTAHSNSPRDTISRIETMVMMAGYDLPIRAIREQIASAIDVIIQIARIHDGSRKVISITEVVGMEGDIVTLQEIIGYKMQGLDENGKAVGRFYFTGIQPTCSKAFEAHGIPFDLRVLAKMREG